MKKRVLHLLFLLLSVQLHAQLNMELASQIDYSPRLNDVWGWFNPADSSEYAIVGLVTGVSIVNVTDPYNAEEVAFIPGINSTWRDIKTWKDHAYVSNESGDGITVIDLSQLPNAAPSYQWEPDIDGVTLSSCHNLFVDENGVLYLTGANVNNGGAVFVDVDTDPSTPSVIGKGVSVYSHDIYARGDTLYTSEIYRGEFRIYDIKDKNDAILLGRQKTPFNFTHNTWLSDNGKVLFTTDERGNAPVAAYDISDLDNITLLDEYRPLTSLGRNVVPHNAHVWNDWLLISYYTDGGRIVDISRPENMIEVGNFDSFFGVDGGTNGVWGAYPFLPSQTALLSDRVNGLIVCVPNYVYACWLEGTVTEKGTGVPLNSVDVHIESSQANIGLTGNDGRYETGQAIPGDFVVTFQKTGYRPKAVTVNLQNGVLTELDVELEPLTEVVLTGSVIDETTGMGIPGAKVVFEDYFYRREATADNTGAFSISQFYPGDYEVVGGLWGYQTKGVTTSVGNAGPVQIELTQGYSDGFALDLGWQTEADASVTSGNWVIAEPIGTILSEGDPAAPGEDISDDIGKRAFVTGTGGGDAGDNDVDGGKVTLTSPVFDLTDYSVPILNFSYWFVNAEGTGGLNDSLTVRINNGFGDAVLMKIGGENGFWQNAEINIKDFIPLSGNMQLFFEAEDADPGHIVEAAIDGFKITESDNDGDGYGADDCDDNNASISPGASEIPNNNVDEDCDGVALIIDDDMDGFHSGEDCDDSNASINPDAMEIPNNNVDEDCDGVALIIDDDMDGFHSGEDCDDSNASINPDAMEIPNNNVDEDCDGVALIIDDDMDGFHSGEDCDDSNASINPDAMEIPNNNVDEDCDGVALIIDDDMDGFHSGEDCDDSNASINPDAMEVPNNNVDEDCDGVALIIDDDMDGFHSGEDCDDSNASINPDAMEIPNNNVDEDCDGVALIIDDDMDGFHSGEDCDDSNASINPDAMEIPNNNVDEDCDGVALIIDDDMDGFNSDEDCDDSNASINPDAMEVPNNNVDEDCDGVALIIDDDMDGFHSGEDCDDSNASINPDAMEIPNNNVDEDCDGVALIIDDDMDGFNSDEDCDDSNPNINPDAMEIPNNNVDEDCDGVALVIDDDMDGFNSDEDCDDSNPNINPNATEIPDNGIDEDCDGMDAVSSVTDIELESLVLYPNPFSDVLTIRSEITGQVLFRIYDPNGKLIYDENLQISDQNTFVNLSDLTPGLYSVRIQKESGATIYKKIVKVK